MSILNVFYLSHSGPSGPQSAKPGRFSPPKPAFFTGVVAGFDGLTRRWNCGGGKSCPVVPGPS